MAQPHTDRSGQIVPRKPNGGEATERTARLELAGRSESEEQTTMTDPKKFDSAARLLRALQKLVEAES